MANLFAAMKGALGHILDPCTLQALEVSAAMAAAGASQEDIEEMMAMIMSAGTGGISEDFLVAIKEAMLHGGTKIIVLLLTLIICKFSIMTTNLVRFYILVQKFLWKSLYK